MKFYIFSFIIHMIFIFSFINFSKKNFNSENKNLVIYLSELKVEGKGNPNPASIKNTWGKKENEEGNKKIDKEKDSKKIEKNSKGTYKKLKKSEQSKNNKNENKKELKKIENKNNDTILGIIKDANGSYIADQRSSQGIGYKVKIEIDPIYPEMAKKMNFKNEVVIQTKFLVGLEGKVEEIIFLDSFNKYGFRKEVEKALKKWEFEPIIYKGKNIKMYFYKDFRFNVK